MNLETFRLNKCNTRSSSPNDILKSTVSTVNAVNKSWNWSYIKVFNHTGWSCHSRKQDFKIIWQIISQRRAWVGECLWAQMIIRLSRRNPWASSLLALISLPPYLCNTFSVDSTTLPPSPQKKGLLAGCSPPIKEIIMQMQPLLSRQVGRGSISHLLQAKGDHWTHTGDSTERLRNPFRI